MHKKEKNSICCNIFVLLMHWNIIMGMCECLSQLPYFTFLKYLPDNSIFFSIIFIFISFFIVITNKNLNKMLLLPLLWFPAMVMTLLINPSIGKLAMRATIYYLLNICCYIFLFSYVDNYEMLYNKIKQYIPLSVCYVVLLTLLESDITGYSMSFTYATMIPSLACLITAFRGNLREKLFYIPFIVLLLMNLKIGSRASIVCYVLVIIIDLLFFSKGTKKAKYIVLIILLIIVLITQQRIIFIFLQEKFPNSRNIRLLVNGLALYDAGRTKHYQKILSEIARNPFLFRGLYSDRFFLATNISNIDEIWGLYTHNIVLEMIFQLGIFGYPLIILLIKNGCVSYRVVKRTNKESLIRVFEIVIAYALGQLMISSSYLVAPSFGIFLGLIFKTIKDSRKEKIKTVIGRELFKV